MLTPDEVKDGAPALEAWGGKPSGVKTAQDALYHRARCNGAASRGEYAEAIEKQAGDAVVLAHRAHWSDD